MAPQPTSSTRQRPSWLVGLLLGVATAGLLLATAPGLPMVWDEGSAVTRSEGILRWVRRWRPSDPWGQQARPWTAEAIDEDWPFVTRIEGHPAGYGILIAAGRSLGAGWLDPLTAARLGPILFFALAAGALGAWMTARFSPTAAVLGVGAMVLMPRLFAHAHFASFDGPLTAGWVLALVTFDAARRRARFLVPFGLVLGATLSMKATGWIAPVPLVAWTLLAHDRAGFRVLLIGLPVALATFYAVDPPLWHDPIDGVLEFFRLNLDRAAQGWNIPTQFLGEIYHLGRPLPWYNTLLWTAVSVPLPLLALVVVGLVAVWRRPDWQGPGGLLVLGAATLLVVRALPGTPPHDGVRQFLPSFAPLAALAGLGAAWLLERAGTPSEAYHARAAWTARLTVAAIYVGSATSLVWYAPQWLSYYNLLIGGLPGATAAGMEPTYYWDALDGDVLAWLDEHTPPGEKIRFAAGATESLDWMRRWGKLRRGFRPEEPGAFRWYVLQQRPSAHSDADRSLLAHRTPAYVKRIRSSGWGPWRLDVPLILVYPLAENKASIGKGED